MRLNTLMPLLALLACTPHCGVGARWLKAEADSCNATAAAWNYEACHGSLYYSDMGYGGMYSATSGGVTTAMPVPMPIAASAAAGAVSNTMDSALAALGGVASSGGAGGTAASETLGFATGGAQDVENFRENIDAGYLPLPTDLTFEGLAKDYYFNTTSNTTHPCSKLFCPVYSVGLSPDPLLGTPQSSEFYMAVGLDSGMQAADFARKQLNLVLVLDVSGSMGETFNQYYYDAATRPSPMGGNAEEKTKKKIDVAKEVLTGIVGLLKPQDSLSVVLFSDGACVPKPLGPVRCSDVEALRKQINADVMETGGTNFQAGIDAAAAQLTGCQACMEANRSAVENRVIFLTDAQPNAGDDSKQGLLARVKALSADGVYTTIIGMGLDFNTQLVEAISKVKGANYFSVHTPGEFKRRLVDEFDYAVTPLVFDLALSVRMSSADQKQGEGWKILHVYGSPNTNMTQLSSDGTVMKVHTLFPTPKTEAGIKGGVVLLRMKRSSDAATPLTLDASYEDREGNKLSSVRTVEVPAAVMGDGTAEYYQSSGVEKAVALARYTDIMHGWLLDEWGSVDPGQPIVIPQYGCSSFPSWYCPVQLYGPQPLTDGCVLKHWLLPDACVLPPPRPIWPSLLGRWERQSQPLAVNSQAGAALREFLPYFEGKVEATGDRTMEQEVKILKKLITTSDTEA